MKMKFLFLVALVLFYFRHHRQFSGNNLYDW